eukprot:472618-Lingulodinium_polyedra.AAC.1
MECCGRLVSYPLAQARVGRGWPAPGIGERSGGRGGASEPVLQRQLEGCTGISAAIPFCMPTRVEGRAGCVVGVVGRGRLLPALRARGVRGIFAAAQQPVVSVAAGGVAIPVIPRGCLARFGARGPAVCLLWVRPVVDS